MLLSPWVCETRGLRGVRGGDIAVDSEPGVRFSFGYQSPGATLHRQACGFMSGGADFVPRHCGLSGEHALRRCEGWRQHGQPLQAMETPVSLIPPEWGGRWGALCERAAHLAFSSGIPDLLTSRANCPGLLRDPLFLHHTQLLRLLVVLALLSAHLCFSCSLCTLPFPSCLHPRQHQTGVRALGTPLFLVLSLHVHRASP